MRPKTDKTGAPTTVTAEPDRYTIAVDGHEVGKAEFLDRGNQRVFTHTEVDKNYEGRGPGNDSHRRGIAGDPRRRAADRGQVPDGRRLRLTSTTSTQGRRRQRN